MKFFFFLATILFVLNATAQNAVNVKVVNNLKKEATENIQKGYDAYKNIALNIWGFAEVGYKEVKSSALLQSTLKSNGFNVEVGVAGMPTAFVATYGTGQPVIALLAEFDALPGISQDSAATKTPLNGKTSSHACGHHLFGTGSVAAGIAIKKLLEDGKIKGTIKVFGTPAEEGGSGKVYMVRQGLFNDVDVVIHWHPSDNNSVTYTSALANKSAKIRSQLRKS